MRFAHIALSALLATVCLPVLAQGAGGLVIAPTRLVIGPKERMAEAAVTNVSDKPMRYKVEMQDQIMTASGTTTVTDTFAYSAKPYVRYMPKVLDLPPGKRQVIRLMVTRPEGLADGDYHTHMLFDEMIIPVSATAPKEDKTGVSMQVEMAYSMGIPVILQQGTLSSSVVLQGADLVRNESGQITALNVRMERGGNAEGMARLTGNLANGERAFPTRNVRIYRERDNVTLTVPLDKTAREAAPSEIILNVYADGSHRNASPTQTYVAK